MGLAASCGGLGTGAEERRLTERIGTLISVELHPDREVEFLNSCMQTADSEIFKKNPISTLTHRIEYCIQVNPIAQVEYEPSHQHHAISLGVSSNSFSVRNAITFSAAVSVLNRQVQSHEYPHYWTHRSNRGCRIPRAPPKP